MSSNVAKSSWLSMLLKGGALCVAASSVILCVLVKGREMSLEVNPLSPVGKQIYAAARAGDMAALRPLVQEWSGNDVLNWANPDYGWFAQSWSGWTPLHIACSEDKVEAVKLLSVAPGIDINKANEDGMTAILIAIRKNHTEVVTALVNAPGIDINRAENSSATALMWAALKGNTEVVKALLAAPGIDVNKASSDGGSVVMYAAHNGHIDIVRALLAMPSVDVNKANNDGWTAIMLAIAEGHIEVVRAFLVAPGIDVNKANKDGVTAIMTAAQMGHTEIVRALLAIPGIDVSKGVTAAGDFQNKTALDLAIKYNKPEIAILLSAIRVAPAGTGKHIYDAAESGDMAALGPLVQDWSGNDVLNWANPQYPGYTPLIAGSGQGKLEAVKLLLKTPGIDVNKANNNTGFTALMLAANNGHTDVVRALLAASGIDVNKSVTDSGEFKRKTALGLAMYWSKPDIAALLKAAGAKE